MDRRSGIRAFALACLAAAALPASAVYLDPSGIGQALIYPYYTAQSTGTAFNTLITVVNRGTDSKVIRVRFREGRNAREVASFNLYLGGRDTWTGAVIADAGGARFITADQSCVNPVFPPSVDGPTRFFEFSNASLGDGAGTDAGRLREGFIEMIEMGTLTGNEDAAVRPPTNVSNPTGPSNCAAVQGPSVAFQVNPPTGNLSGTLTLINVATGMNFTVNAVALGQLSTRAFYRSYTDPYPDFTALEVDPVSVVPTSSGTSLITWSTGLDAVASVLMNATVGGETILDSATRSGTEWVITFPMRPLRQPGTSTPPAAYPRTVNAGYSDVQFSWAPRDGGPTSTFTNFDFAPNPPNVYAVNIALPWAATVVSFAHGSAASAGPIAASSVLGSLNAEQIMLPTAVEDGMGTFTLNGTAGPAVAKTFSYSSGAVGTQPVTLNGAPAVGFWVRTYLNGILTCGTATCLGNYGGAYPLVTTH
jgi:hypothetical protein